MKVRVDIVVDVDPQAYRDEYGTSDTVAEIREDIRLRVYDAARESLNRFSFFNDMDITNL